MRHGVLDESAIAKPVRRRPLETLELVAQPNHAAVRHLGAVAFDDAPSFVGIFGVDGNPHLAETVDGHGKDRMRQVRPDDGRHAVRLEQPADDARLDVRVRAEDDCEISQRSTHVGVHSAISAGSASIIATSTPRSPIFNRIIVISSCCGAAPTNASISRSTRSRSSLDGR